MSMENIRDLFLEDETFEDARNKFNTVLQRLFRSMIDTESNEGSITLKMDVSMQTEFIPNHDPDVEGESPLQPEAGKGNRKQTGTVGKAHIRKM